MYPCEVNFGILVKNPIKSQKTPKKSQNFLHTKYVHFQKMNVANVYFMRTRHLTVTIKSAQFFFAPS